MRLRRLPDRLERGEVLLRGLVPLLVPLPEDGERSPLRPTSRQEPLGEVWIEERKLAPLMDQQRLGAENCLRAPGP
jgi:hypothetical protein